MAFHPYLFFGGNCREAFTRYHEIFGGELALMSMSDLPPGEDPPPAGKEHYIIHAAIKYDGNLLMGSDDPMADEFGPVQGMQINYTAPDLDDANRVFDALAEGGEVWQALTPTFFSPGFGMCQDRFGTPWMVDVDAPEPT